MRITKIGTIHSKFDEQTDARVMKKEVSVVEVFEEYASGLSKLEKSEFIDIIFEFDRSTDYELDAKTLWGDEKGVFATRSPQRPSSIGVSSVRLIKIEGRELHVKGLDALNGSPVLDIKPSDTSLLQENLDEIRMKRLKSNPRKDIVSDIVAGNTDKLLLNAAQIHGHFCPGLALGIMAATFAMQQIRAESDGLEDLLAIVETNNCFSDGIQFVTGCSFGNNALIFNDLGKTAFTLTKRDGKGIRINTRKDSKTYMKEANEKFSPEYAKLVAKKDHSEESREKFKKYGVEAAFNTLKLDFDKIFIVEQIQIDIPDYAPSHESLVCTACDEAVMASRISKKEDQVFCLACAKEQYGILDGDGIR